MNAQAKAQEARNNNDKWLAGLMEGQRTDNYDEFEGTFTKLRDGSWGVRIKDFEGKDAEQDCLVRINKRNGDVAEKHIYKIVVRFDDAILCSIY